ncbi:MAG: TIGR01777 family oxidoreductase [Armatimonadota bacterium]|nr:TIGR01777 family oxidoreductase [Armatimonadota bacterium]MDW8155689.1 TIGR01777 family oxidoreductase [Armatimonadota bacterium]
MRVAVVGATGLLGKALKDHLEAAGHTVVPVSRRPLPGGLRWDPARGHLEAGALEGCHAVVNLAGARIAPARWTEAYKQELRASRVEATRLLAATLARLARPPEVFLSASATGYYGHRPFHEVLDEGSGPGRGFLASLCVEWEAATEPARRAGIRTVLLRTGPVLSRQGGFLAPLVPLFRLGLGGPVGDGQQGVSWIALEDWVRAAEYLTGSVSVEGPVNLTAPNPVTFREFARVLARVLRRPAVVRAPAFVVRAMFGHEMAQEVLLSGQRAVPKRLREAGFRFDYPELEGALRRVLG